MPSSFRPCLALLTAALLLPAPSSAFNTPLSDQAVREAYFLGQRRDESMAAFLNKYTKLLPAPKSGPHIYSVTFLTPIALLVQYSSRQSDYRAQRAALDHKAHDEIVEISIEILLTPSYRAVLTVPTHSRSGPPAGVFNSVPPSSGASLSTASSTAMKRSPRMTSRASPSTAA
jgi:hypothetical protein